jgi:hypothetical protein
MSHTPVWLVCDKGICLYCEESTRKMHVERCIKHGAILGYDYRLSRAQTRQEARAILMQDTK